MTAHAVEQQAAKIVRNPNFKLQTESERIKTKFVETDTIRLDEPSCRSYRSASMPIRKRKGYKIDLTKSTITSKGNT